MSSPPSTSSQAAWSLDMIMSEGGGGGGGGDGGISPRPPLTPGIGGAGGGASFPTLPPLPAPLPVSPFVEEQLSREDKIAVGKVWIAPPALSCFVSSRTRQA